MFMSVCLSVCVYVCVGVFGSLSDQSMIKELLLDHISLHQANTKHEGHKYAWTESEINT